MDKEPYQMLSESYTFKSLTRSISKAIGFKLRHAHPRDVQRDAGCWVTVDRLAETIDRWIRGAFYACLNELIDYIVTMPDDKMGRFEVAFEVKATKYDPWVPYGIEGYRGDGTLPPPRNRRWIDRLGVPRNTR